MTTVEILKEMAFTATETQRRALEDAISDLSENKGDLISRQKVLNTLDNMDKTLDEERTVDNYKELVAECIKVLPSVENKGDKSCNTCKNNDDELSGECYECVKNIQNHYEPKRSE